MSRIIETIVDGVVVRSVVKKWLITHFSLKEQTIESTLGLTELYQKYETAMTIEEI